VPRNIGCVQRNIVIAITSTLARSNHWHIFGSACSRVWRTAVRHASAQRPALQIVQQVGKYNYFSLRH
jgi:hypothetical protein